VAHSQHNRLVAGNFVDHCVWEAPEYNAANVLVRTCCLEAAELQGVLLDRLQGRLILPDEIIAEPLELVVIPERCLGGLLVSNRQDL